MAARGIFAFRLPDGSGPWGLPVLGIITIFIVVGWAILFIVWVWYIYRHVRGLIALLNGEPMPR